MQTENDSGFPKLSAPARRALDAAGIRRLDDLARVTEAELANWHGIGPTAVKALASALDQRGLSFKACWLSTSVPLGSQLGGMAIEHPRAGLQYPSNLHELMAWFPDDGACLRYLERLRWGEGFVCRFCGSVGGGWWQMGDGLRRCAECRSETSVTAGTIFAGTRTPLVSWFAAVWYVVNQKQGVSALGLQRVLGLGSYQTAWAWLHKLRRAMVLPGRELVCGAVEVDECYIGARRQGSGGRGAVGKAIVVIAVEERGQGPGRVRLRRVPNVTKDTLTDFVLDHVARHSEVRTDGWQGYFDIGKYRFQHVVTNVSASGDPAHVVLAHVHLVASLVKRWILGTHQGAVSHHQLDYYLDEFTFRFNRRHSRHRGLLFYRLLQGAMATDPHPYRTLTRETAA